MFGVAYAGILAMPFAIESIGVILAACGMATQAILLIIAQKLHARNLAETLINSGIGRGAVFIVVTLSVFFSVCQILTLSGVVPKGTLVIW